MQKYRLYILQMLGMLFELNIHGNESPVGDHFILKTFSLTYRKRLDRLAWFIMVKITNVQI